MANPTATLVMVSCPGRSAAPSARFRASSTRYGGALQNRDPLTARVPREWVPDRRCTTSALHGVRDTRVLQLLPHQCGHAGTGISDPLVEAMRVGAPRAGIERDRGVGEAASPRFRFRHQPLADSPGALGGL